MTFLRSGAVGGSRSGGAEKSSGVGQQTCQYSAGTWHI